MLVHKTNVSFIEKLKEFNNLLKLITNPEIEMYWSLDNKYYNSMAEKNNNIFNIYNKEIIIEQTRAINSNLTKIEHPPIEILQYYFMNTNFMQTLGNELTQNDIKLENYIDLHLNLCDKKICTITIEIFIRFINDIIPTLEESAHKKSANNYIKLNALKIMFIKYVY